jgi:hypothetical protein
MPSQVVHKYDMDQRTKSYLARKLGCYVTELSQFYSLDQTQTGNVTRFVSSSLLFLVFEPWVSDPGEYAAQESL